ncbi:MAG TPA: hypothetical protein VJ385_08530 [Fibrobacteria bacterium]|nr:hypothetical protein [Fibrobacteria bacterium]
MTIPIPPDARPQARTEWHCTFEEPGAEWNRAGFDDALWPAALGGFGSGTVHHDDDAEAYLNGILVRQASGWST